MLQIDRMVMFLRGEQIADYLQVYISLVASRSSVNGYGGLLRHNTFNQHLIHF